MAADMARRIHVVHMVLSLEPGGQFELSGAPLRTLHETHAETADHLREVREVAGQIGR